MTTLNLQKKHKGVYEIDTDQITISVSNPKSDSGIGPNLWQLLIIDKTNDWEIILNEWFSTKKEASKFGAQWVILNL